MDSVIIRFFENNRTISYFSFFFKISIANNSKVKSVLDWLMFLDLELSINSNFTTLLTGFPISVSLSFLKTESKKIFVDGKYFISEILTLDSAHIADIICKSSGD